MNIETLNFMANLEEIYLNEISSSHYFSKEKNSKSGKDE